MATSDYDRDRIARNNRSDNTGMSATGIIFGLVVAALLIGFIAFAFTDRTPSGSTATSERPTVTAPQTPPRTATPPASTTPTPAPAPSTK
jgi:hypothetical protein